MAGLLYRLGRFSARRAWLVICAWAVILGLAIVAFHFGSGHLSDAISIPNTPTTQVENRLTHVLGKNAAGNSASGTIVVQRSTSGALSSAQQTQIGDMATAIDKVSGVKSVTNPFTELDQLNAQKQKVADGQKQLTAAKQQLATSQQQLDASKQQLAAGQTQLDAAIAQAKAAGAYEAAQAQFAAQQAKITAGQAQIAAGQAKITAGQKKIEAEQTTLTQGAQLLTMAKGAMQVSPDGRTAIVTVTVNAAAQQIPTATAQAIRDAADKAAPTGATVDFSQELTTQAFGGSTEAIGVIIAAIVLAIMLGTLIAAGLPLLNAILGVGASYLFVMSFSKLVDMNSTTPILALMLGLAVGIDYTLFILNRHRQQLQRGMEVQESIGLATGTSGSAVMFAGITVIVALVALNVTGISFLGLMGAAAALAVAIAVLVAITLTPAILGLSGHRVLPKRIRRRIGSAELKAAKPVKPMSTTRAWVTAVASVLVLGAIALPATQLRLGLPDGGSQPANSTQYRAFEKVVTAFGAGFNAPLIVVADVPSGLSSSELTTRELEVGQHLESTKDIAAVVPVTASAEHSVIVFQVIPKGGQNDVSTNALVQHLRSNTTSGMSGDFQVAGATSANIDITDYLARALPPYLAVVIGLSILIMIGVFRSLLLPLLATGGFVLSLFAALGGVTAIFQFGWLGFLFGVHDPGPVLSFLPTLMVGILFGLAMDYMLFIGTGIREAYVHGAEARVAVVSGLRAGRAVVTAAALIMTAVFSGFIFSDNTIISALGFGLAFGVLADAFVVRMLLIPSLLHIFGRAAWWLPKWLDRIVLDVDVEGAKLERTHPLPHAEGEPEEILI